MKILLLSVVGVLVGLWMLNDANRFARHVEVAGQLIRRGIPENEAMEQSGSNFWMVPWYRRIFKPYPPLPTN